MEEPGRTRPRLVLAAAIPSGRRQAVGRLSREGSGTSCSSHPGSHMRPVALTPSPACLSRPLPLLTSCIFFPSSSAGRRMLWEASVALTIMVPSVTYPPSGLLHPGDCTSASISDLFPPVANRALVHALPGAQRPPARLLCEGCHPHPYLTLGKPRPKQ